MNIEYVVYIYSIYIYRISTVYFITTSALFSQQFKYIWIDITAEFADESLKNVWFDCKVEGRTKVSLSILRTQRYIAAKFADEPSSDEDKIDSTAK